MTTASENVYQINGVRSLNGSSPTPTSEHDDDASQLSLGNTAQFAEARMADTVAEFLCTDFLWCKALGWMRWSGKVWESATDESVGEAVRGFFLGKLASVIDQMRRRPSDGDQDILDSWRSYLTMKKQHAVIGACRGILEYQAKEFDADPDLLNTPCGIVNLKTGEVTEHNPEALMTKMTVGHYRPGYTHPDWDAALEALPGESRYWYQTRIGQGITGRPTPDGIMPILNGSGENGKSLLSTDGLLPALGDYASPASPKLISAQRGMEHSTEMADLHGRRLVIAEEMTESRALDVTAIKRIMDVGRIKARKMHKDNIEFNATHSLFATTNYEPTVNETDHGTWRRLALLVFPYTFRKEGEDLITETDRRGDEGLKVRIKEGLDGQHDAIVTWAIEGALRWAVEGPKSLVLPARVAADTLAWRSKADKILGLWTERLVPDPSACVLAADLLIVFNQWLEENGYRAWAKETFASKFGQHGTTKGHRVEHRRVKNPAGLVRDSRAAFARSKVPAQPWVWMGVRYQTES